MIEGLVVATCAVIVGRLSNRITLRPKWRIVAKTVGCVSDDGKRKDLTGTKLYLKKGFSKIPLTHPTEDFAVEIGDPNYGDLMREWREIAKQAIIDLNVNQRMLKS